MIGTALWTLLFMQIFSIAITVAMIGKERRPLTSGTAAITVVVNGAIAFLAAGALLQLAEKL